MFEAKTYPTTPTPTWPAVACDQTGERSWVWRTIFDGVKYQNQYEAHEGAPAWVIVIDQARCWSGLIKLIQEKATPGVGT